MGGAMGFRSRLSPTKTNRGSKDRPAFTLATLLISLIPPALFVPFTLHKLVRVGHNSCGGLRQPVFGFHRLR